MKQALENPWLGLRSYPEGITLYGRNNEILELSQKIIYNTQTIVYGRSGIGKSSLIKAGIFPILRRHNFFPVYIRLVHNEDHDSYTQQIITAVEASLKRLRIEDLSADVDAMYRFIEGCKEEIVPAFCPDKEENLWEYFHRHKFYYVDEKDERHYIMPVMIFDQFEEIFTLQKDSEKTKNFFNEFANLANNTCPKELLIPTVDTTPTGTYTPTGSSLIKKGIVRKAVKLDYIDESNFHFVISIREDFLSHLERNVSHIPSLKHNRYCLLPLSEDQAAEIIMQPVPGLISKEVAKEIICKVTDAPYDSFEIDNNPELEVDSAILSLFLSELYKKKEPDSHTITCQQVAQLGSNIISDFYKEIIENLKPESKRFLEENLITSDGFRKEVPKSDAINSGITQEEIDILKENRIIKVEIRNQSERIEYSHDVLCKIVSEHLKLEKLEEENNKKEAKLLERNREYNRQRRLNNLNVLNIKGRRLNDNALDFGEYQTTNKSKLRNKLNSMILLANQWARYSDELFKNEKNIADNFIIFSDPLLKDATFRINFQDKNHQEIYSSDGIYAISLKYNRNLISDIYFFDNSTCKNPVYILGGFCAIHIDYDNKDREIRRSYKGEDQTNIQNIDGYSIIETEYDKNDNPIKIRYYNNSDNQKIPCSHINGNHGYNSIFDDAGNEIERIFVDCHGEPTKIVSGVWGKKMKYDQDCHLIELSNIDKNGNLIADIDGYVTIKYEYDNQGRQYKEFYYDENDNLWKSPSNIYGIEAIYDTQNLIVGTYNLDKDKVNYIEDKDGIYNQIFTFNNKHQLTNIKNLNKENKYIEIDGTASYEYSFDKFGRICKTKNFNKHESFTDGILCDYDKRGRLFRLWSIDANEEIILNNNFGDEKHPVYGIEFDTNYHSDEPILSLFINKNKQFTKCGDEYYGFRRWENEKGETIKKCYYNKNGTPMPNYAGVYGTIFEYSNNTQKCINIDNNGEPINNKYGVCYTITISKEGQESSSFYNKKEEPVSMNGVHNITIETRNIDEYQIITTKLFDKNNHLIKDFFTEEIYDHQNRLILKCNKQTDGAFVPLEEGCDACIQKTEYSEDLVETTFYLNKDNNPCIGPEGYYKKRKIIDIQGRTIGIIYYNTDNTPLKLPDGSFGRKYEYENNNEKTTKILNKDGEPTSYKVETFDTKGRVISQRYLDKNKTLVDNIIEIKEYIDNDERTNGYYIHHLNIDNNPISINNDEIYYTYVEEDETARPIKRLFYGIDKEQKSDQYGAYGLRIEYNNNNKKITVLDKNGNPTCCNDLWTYKIISEISDKIQTERFFDSNDNPCKNKDNHYGYIKEVYDKYEIIGFLDKNGYNCYCEHGYAFIKKYLDNSAEYKIYLDTDKDPTISTEDDINHYGTKTIRENNIKTITSLDINGNPKKNSLGYVHKHIKYKENGFPELIYCTDTNGDLIKDKYGDYATQFNYADDNSRSRIRSLDKSFNIHTNYWGYADEVKITDIAGDEVSIYLDKNGRPTIPNLRSWKSRFYNNIHKYLCKKDLLRIQNEIIEYKNKKEPYIIIVEHNDQGWLKDNNFDDKYILLRFNNWHIGDSINKLGINFNLSMEREEHIMIIPYKYKENINDLSKENIIEINAPQQLGPRFTADYEITQEQYKRLKSIYNLYKNNNK